MTSEDCLYDKNPGDVVKARVPALLPRTDRALHCVGSLPDRTWDISTSHGSAVNSARLCNIAVSFILKLDALFTI